MRKMYTRRVGDPSSEFGMPDGGEKFERKVQARIERASHLWEAFVGFMQEHDVRPDELRTMFAKYWEEYLQ